MSLSARKPAFTLVELLVVIGVIALLISILLPALNKARKSAQMTACLSNLRVCGQALVMYSNENKGYVPYPTTSLYEEIMWSTALDKYIMGFVDKTRGTGVASKRSYSRVKQCVVYDEFDDHAATGA